MHRRETSDKGNQGRMDDRTDSSDPQPPQLVTFDAILPPAMARSARARINTDPMTRISVDAIAKNVFDVGFFGAQRA